MKSQGALRKAAKVRYFPIVIKLAKQNYFSCLANLTAACTSVLRFVYRQFEIPDSCDDVARDYIQRILTTTRILLIKQEKGHHYFY